VIDLFSNVVGIVETWLDNSTLCWTMTLTSSYSLVRLDRNRSRHGDDVLLYIRDDFSYNVTF